jgi:cobalt/nickel transport system permease protein
MSEASAKERRFRELAASRGLRPSGEGHVGKTLRRISAFFADSLFREETARRNGLAQRTDPRVRLLAVLGFLASVSFARRIPVLLAHAVLPFAAVVFSRIRFREFLGAGFLVAVLFSTLMAAPATLNLFRDGEVVRPLLRLSGPLRFGPYAIPATVGITREGLLSAATFLLRVLPSVAAVLWLTLTTRWTDLLRSLRFLRLPPLFLQVTGMTVRYTHALLRQLEEIHLGKKSRTVCRTPASRERAWAGSRIGASWERSLRLMEETADAMKARGFTGEAKFPPQARFGWAGWGIVAAVVLFCAGAHFL